MPEGLLFRSIFALPIVMVGSVAALHATGYLHGDGLKRRGWFWFYFCGTLASMAAVVAVDSKLAFLLAWEAMGLFSSGLVGFESATREAKRATWIYLLACQAGAFCLMLGFYGRFGDSPSCRLLPSALLFLGFALKIGFPPFHVWLPEAHPAAPAPASAVMSGAMIPLGFYGILRWGAAEAWPLLAFGVLAALGGILFALPQRNLKKLLAFSSVENMGVVALGLSLGLFATAAGSGTAARLAYAGAFLHVLNHALLKGALFLGAGSVLRMTGTLDVDRMGGLMKKMPWTGTLFTLNAFGLSGLPPLNGFVSEALVYIAAFSLLADRTAVLPAAVVLVALALTGGIASAVYAKAVSAAFLGEARGDLSDVEETPKRMVAAIAALTALSCVLSGTVLFVVPVAAAWFLRRLLPRGCVNPRQPTWDCGYEAPTARMAWTGSAFSQPLADTFRGVLKPRQHRQARFDGGLSGRAPLPLEMAVASETDDAGISRLFGPLFHLVARQFQRWHLFQSGSLHFYVLMMILAIVALLIWGALA